MFSQKCEDAFSAAIAQFLDIPLNVPKKFRKLSLEKEKEKCMKM